MNVTRWLRLLKPFFFVCKSTGQQGRDLFMTPKLWRPVFDEYTWFVVKWHGLNVTQLLLHLVSFFFVCKSTGRYTFDASNVWRPAVDEYT